MAGPGGGAPLALALCLGSTLCDDPRHPSARVGVRCAVAVAVILAVTTAEIGGDGWESNPPRTPQQRPANGFEDRGRHQPPIIPSAATLTTD